MERKRYDKREVMIEAWKLVRRKGISIGDALKESWYYHKKFVDSYNAAIQHQLATKIDIKLDLFGVANSAINSFYNDAIGEQVVLPSFP